MAEPQRWPRPVPTVGDTTAASERRVDPMGWGFPVGVRDGLYEVVLARRDVRRFRSDPVPEAILRRVLAAAHAGPSVGHSQPWRFVVVTEQGSRDRAALLADRERLRQAGQMPPERARRLLDLQLEGVREAPLGVVVACDRRASPAGVLGRATFPDTDLWSCACAIENLWLAARAEGLGVGWVTFFQPADLVALLGLPEGVETLGWLCLGWPDERPPAPGLERAGWSVRLPLEDVVFSERWPGSPVAPPREHLLGPVPARVVAVRDRADVALTAPGSLGILDRAVDRLLASSADPAEGGALVIVAADHAVTAHGVSTYPTSVTTDVLAATIAGRSLGATAAAGAGLAVLAVDARAGAVAVPGARQVPVPGPVGDLVCSDALPRGTAEGLVQAGRVIGVEVSAGGSGIVALGEIGVGNTTVAAALAAVLLGLDAADVVGLGAGGDSQVLARKTIVIGAALARVRPQLDCHDPMAALAALGGAEAAVLTGVVLGAASHGATVVLDGLLTSVAALVAVRLNPAVARYLVAAQRSREQAHSVVLTELGLEPLLDLRLRAGEGVGACLGVTLLRQGAAVRLGSGQVDH